MDDAHTKQIFGNPAHTGAHQRSDERQEMVDEEAHKDIAAAATWANYYSLENAAVAAWWLPRECEEEGPLLVLSRAASERTHVWHFLFLSATSLKSLSLPFVPHSCEGEKFPGDKLGAPLCKLAIDTWRDKRIRTEENVACSPQRELVNKLDTPISLFTFGRNSENTFSCGIPLDSKEKNPLLTWRKTKAERIY